MKKTLIITVFNLVFILPNFAQTKMGLADFHILDGAWTGTLTYLNYSDNKTGATLKMTADFKQTTDSILWLSRYDEGKGRFVEGKSHIKMLPNGDIDFYETPLKVEKKEKIGGKTTILLVGKGTDNGKTADIHETISRQADTLTIRREVKTAEQSTYFMRHEYRLVKNWAADFVGTWQIDLRPSPKSEPYLKEFMVSELKDGTFSGTFYGTAFTEGKIHTAWGILHFAFTTRDASSTYFHSGTIENGVVKGRSFSPERGFIMPWSGRK